MKGWHERWLGQKLIKTLSNGIAGGYEREQMQPQHVINENVVSETRFSNFWRMCVVEFEARLRGDI